MENKKKKVLIFLLVVILTYLFFANWESFKAGLSGDNPSTVEELTD